MAQLMLANPRRRKRTASRRRSPARRTTSRRRRRNPIPGNKMMDTFTTGAVGGAGALAVDLVMTKLPIPAALTTNSLMSAATKGFIGIGIGMLVSKTGRNKKMGAQLAQGAATVAMYNAGRAMIGPTLGLSGMDDGLLGYGDGLLGYDDFDDLGYMEPVPVSSWDADDDLGEYSEFGTYDDF